MKICVIFNPAARGERAKRFRDHLAALSAQCVLKPTYSPGAGRALAAEAVREGCETVVAAGGDGTVNEVLNGIGDEPEGFSRVRLGVLPLGTVNVFAHELGLPMGFSGAWQVIARGQTMALDLAEAEFNHAGEPRRRCFVQMAGAGLDARAVELVNWEQKKRIGRFAYVTAAWKALRQAKPQIIADNGHEAIGGELVLIGNGRLYGGPFRVFPKANNRDGVLDVSIFPRADWGAILRSGWGLLVNQLYSTGGVRHFQAESLRLYSASAVPFEVEGENVGQLPARFSVRRQAVKVLVP
jgi:YegS/Rv2252/BmrU family lipid kinase